jgi:hypothetical protein
MKNYFDKFISYESKHILITIGSILLILAHLIHLVYREDIVVFQILFIIAYILLIIGIIIEQKKINIVILINKLMIIGLVSLGIYYDYNNLNNN